jgi:hypothetical protein
VVAGGDIGGSIPACRANDNWLSLSCVESGEVFRGKLPGRGCEGPQQNCKSRFATGLA